MASIAANWPTYAAFYGPNVITTRPVGARMTVEQIDAVIRPDTFTLRLR